MTSLGAVFQGDLYSLYLCRWHRNQLNVCCWARTDEDGKPAEPAMAYFIEHPIYIDEYHECHQQPVTMVLPSDVILIRLADSEDYELHLIINKMRNNKNLTQKNENHSRKRLHHTSQKKAIRWSLQESTCKIFGT